MFAERFFLLTKMTKYLTQAVLHGSETNLFELKMQTCALK